MYVCMYMYVYVLYVCMYSVCVCVCVCVCACMHMGAYIPHHVYRRQEGRGQTEHPSWSLQALSFAAGNQGSMAQRLPWLFLFPLPIFVHILPGMVRALYTLFKSPLNGFNCPVNIFSRIFVHLHQKIALRGFYEIILSLQL